MDPTVVADPVRTRLDLHINKLSLVRTHMVVVLEASVAGNWTITSYVGHAIA